MTRREIRQEDGFSLVEVLLVFVLVGIALLPLAGVQISSRRAVDEAQRYGEAVTLAETQLEQMRATGFGAAVADSIYQQPFTILTAVSPEIDAGTGLAMTELERITVQVRWMQKSDTLSVALTGLRADRR